MAFDTSVEIETHIRRADGLKTINLRFPSDEEWVTRSRGWSIQVIRQGRGVSETKVDSARADSTLYVKIRSDNSPDLEPDEATKVIEGISRTEVTDVDLEMDQATVHMTVMGGEHVKHILKLPTTAEVTNWKRASVRLIDKPHGRQEMRTNMQPALDLYKSCALATEGYVNGVPAIHKDAAIRAVIEACEMQAEASKDEDF